MAMYTKNIYYIHITHTHIHIWSPAYLTYAEYIMQNARLDEPQAIIKIARKNINTLRYADDTTLRVENEKEALDEGEGGE